MAKQIKAEAYQEPIEMENETEENLNLLDEMDIDEVENKVTKKPIKKTTKSKKKKQKTIKEDEEEDDKSTISPKFNIFMKIFNIIFIIALIVMVIISADIICVAKYNVGPFFAIKTNTYKDGGTKVYYGIGYKVIKYKQIAGRQDTQIGPWNMPYSITPTEVEDIDLAIELQNNPLETGNKYYKQYIKISSTIKTINEQDNKMTLEYTDPDGKYTLQIKCPMASLPSRLQDFKEQQEVIVKGTVNRIALKGSKQPNTIYLSNCFAE